MKTYPANKPNRNIDKKHPVLSVSIVCMTLFASGNLHALDPANVPLFLQESRLPPNILFIPDTSESMQEGLDGRVALDWDNCAPGPDLDPSQCPAGAIYENSKASIVKRVGLNLVDEYQGVVNMGLLSYQQYPAGTVFNDALLTARNPRTVRWRLYHRPFGLSFFNGSTSQLQNYSLYDPEHTEGWGSELRRFADPHPYIDNHWFLYNDGIPGYERNDNFVDFCRTTGAEPTPGVFNAICTANVSISTTHTPSFFGGTTFSGGVNIVDSLRQRNIPNWGSYLNYIPLNQPEWRATRSPGLGYLHVPIGGINSDGSIDTNHWQTITNKLQPQRHNWNGRGNPLTDPSWPLIAAGLTPLEGTMQTARDYFLDFVHPDDSYMMSGTVGSSFGQSQGRNNANQIPRSCGVNATIWVTDGLPSVSSDGVSLGNDLPGALSLARNAVKAFYDDTNVKTYIVGFSMPAGVSSIPGMPDNPLNSLAEAGGTNTAFDATDEESLGLAMSQIFEAIIAESTGSAASVAVASPLYRDGETNLVYQSTFNSMDWSGDLIAYNYIFNENRFAEQWRASNNIPQPIDRNIFTHNGTQGALFSWTGSGASPGLSSDQLNLLSNSQIVSADSTIDGVDLLNYLRGDNSNEVRNDGPFRNRSNLLGNFVNSNPTVQTARLNFGYSQLSNYNQFRIDNQSIQEVVYIGGNAGMLHAFDSQTGEELFAYVPRAVFNKLPSLAEPDYQHQFFVDGQQTIAHAKIDGDWRTVLIGTLGAGGRGIYALDVTDPTNFTADNVLWDLTGDALDSLGFTFGAPTVARTANNQWSVLFSNGYSSNDDEAILLISDLKTGGITEIKTGATNNNGLSEATFRANAQGIIVDGFAGDLKGNLWKFDLTSSNTNQWDVSFGQGNNKDPLFEARGPSNEVQPITARPIIGSHPDGGSIVLFGTGKYIENSDNQVSNPAPVQSFYGVRIYQGISAPLNRNNLLEQSFIASGTINGTPVRASTANTFNSTIHDGWFIDLNFPNAVGERVVERATLIDGRVEFVTLTPSTDDPCAGGGSSSLVALNAATGERPLTPVFDLTGTKLFGSDDMITVHGQLIPPSAIDPGLGISAPPSIIRNPDGSITRVLGGTDADDLEEIAGPSKTSQAPRTWIQLR